MRPSKLNDEQKAEIKTKYEAGATLSALGKEYNVNGQTIRWGLVKAGVKIRGDVGRKATEVEKPKAVVKATPTPLPSYGDKLFKFSENSLLKSAINFGRDASEESILALHHAAVTYSHLADQT